MKEQMDKSLLELGRQTWLILQEVKTLWFGAVDKRACEAGNTK